MIQLVLNRHKAEMYFLVKRLLARTFIVLLEERYINLTLKEERLLGLMKKLSRVLLKIF